MTAKRKKNIFKNYKKMSITILPIGWALDIYSLITLLNFNKSLTSITLISTARWIYKRPFFVRNFINTSQLRSIIVNSSQSELDLTLSLISPKLVKITKVWPMDQRTDISQLTLIELNRLWLTLCDLYWPEKKPLIDPPCSG